MTIQSDSITNKAGTGAPDFPNGLTQTGVTDGSAAAAGDVGEILEASAIHSGSSVTPNGTTYVEVISLSITAGEWLIICHADGRALSGSSATIALGTTSASDTGTELGKSKTNTAISNGSCSASLQFSLSLTSTTPYYLNMNNSTGSAGSFEGTITALRVR
jgi:hypothetical protein